MPRCIRLASALWGRGRAFVFPPVEALLVLVAVLVVPVATAQTCPDHRYLNATWIVPMSTLEASALEFLPGDVLTAYDAQGRCVGRTKWTPGHPPLLVLWADDPVTPDRDGLQKDDPFTIHWQSTKRQATFRLHPTYQDTPTTYAHDRLFLVTSLHAELDMGPLPEPPPPVGDIATTLHAPYPSPASHRLNLMFDLVSFRPVQVEVYDLLGRRVALLADGLYAAGKHELTWSLDALPSGHYLIRMRSGPIHTVKRFVRLR